MTGLLERLQGGEILVSDGAMGTMLIARGLKSGDSPEKLNIDRPEILREIASLYLDAGSDIVSTNTFGGSPLKLADYGLDGQTEKINRAAVRAAKEGAAGRALVAGSVGPCGKLLKPYGDAEPAIVKDSFRRQIAAMLEEDVDVVFVETMTDLTEAVLAVEVTRALSSSIPVAATMTFEVTPRGVFSIMGNTVQQACEKLRAVGADIVGSNCGNGIEKMITIAAEFDKNTDLPLLIQSNAGLPEIEGDILVYSESPQFMADKSRDLIKMGVGIIGGCCGTTPDHIRALRTVVDELSQ